MAGMFYTLMEVAEKLGKSEGQVRQMVQDGKLREFRDGPKLLFKRDEVDALAGDMAAVPDDTLGLSSDDSSLDNQGSTFGLADEDSVEELDLELDASGADLAIGGSDINIELSGSSDDLDISLDDSEAAKISDDSQGSTFGLSDEDNAGQLEDESEDTRVISDADDSQQQSQDENKIKADVADDSQQLEEQLDDLDLGFKDDEVLDLEPSDSAEQDKPEQDLDDSLGLDEEIDLNLGDELAEDIAVGEDDFSLADTDQQEDDLSLELSDSDDEIGLSEETDDTRVDNEGVAILDSSDDGYELTEDTLGETTEISLEGDSSLDQEPSLDEDINLESFGSGSGLLDLSLQADDTSLGAVLEDIIPGAGGDEVPADGFDGGMDIAQEADGVAAVADVGGGAEVASSSGSFAAAPVAAIAYIAPDSSSNIFGFMLIIPIAVSIFTAIIAVAGAKGIVPGLLTATENIIWYIAGGLAVVAVIMMFIGVASGASSDKPKKAKKSAKPKKPKKPKKAKKARK